MAKKEKTLKADDAQHAIETALVIADSKEIQIVNACCVIIMQGGVPVRICWC